MTPIYSPDIILTKFLSPSVSAPLFRTLVATKYACATQTLNK